MKILGIECSATMCSAAVCENGKIIADSFVNVRLTHSQTLMPLIVAMLDNAQLSLDDIEGFAIAAGPGSFTGIRIGISAVKGLAQAKKIPCAPVSTLRAMAEAYKGRSCIVCPVMDARCNQLYNAIFEINGQNITRLTEDRALLCTELAEEIKNLSCKNKEIIILGDGADLFYKFVNEFDGVKLALEPNKYQNASGVALTAEEAFIKGETVSYDELLPVYLRLPQAERELQEKQKLKNNKNIGV